MKTGSLQSIAVTVEDTAAATGNVAPVLHEILHALLRFSADGETTTIDLRAMPFGPGDEDQLLDFLGNGEIQATVESLGRTEIRESRFHGVWVVDYQDADGTRAGLQLEVTEVPALLATPREDIQDAAAALQEALAAMDDQSGQEGNR